MITTLCKMFGCLPSQLLNEDVELLRMMRIVELGTPEEEVSA